MLGKYLPPQVEQKTEEKEKKVATSKFFEVECKVSRNHMVSEEEKEEEENIGNSSFGNSFIGNSSFENSFISYSSY